jgi:hypothetical protein
MKNSAQIFTNKFFLVTFRFALVNRRRWVTKNASVNFTDSDCKNLKTGALTVIRIGNSTLNAKRDAEPRRIFGGATIWGKPFAKNNSYNRSLPYLHGPFAGHQWRFRL